MSIFDSSNIACSIYMCNEKFVRYIFRVVNARVMRVEVVASSRIKIRKVSVGGKKCLQRTICAVVRECSIICPFLLLSKLHCTPDSFSADTALQTQSSGNCNTQVMIECSIKHASQYTSYIQLRHRCWRYNWSLLMS